MAELHPWGAKHLTPIPGPRRLHILNQIPTQTWWYAEEADILGDAPTERSTHARQSYAPTAFLTRYAAANAISAAILGVILAAGSLPVRLPVGTASMTPPEQGGRTAWRATAAATSRVLGGRPSAEGQCPKRSGGACPRRPVLGQANMCASP